ncbi:MAG: fumarylacetoacetate hydrolase family protein [Planctomycetia bacterium]|nr:fumarylacetoacetate hydrolase family protein [Planctomycetia bacterium]
MQLAQVLFKGRKRTAIVTGDELQLLPRPKQGGLKLNEILHHKKPEKVIRKLLSRSRTVSRDQVSWMPPISKQEVWAAGVTYRRSQTARKQESKGAAAFYHKVYQADRPELFFKATPHRIVGHQQAIRIRQDSTWNVPEPELTLVLKPDLKIVGYTIGNDVSSRSIEGENPLYLPQAKTYMGCCAIGPVITLADEAIDPKHWKIHLKIARQDAVVFEGHTAVSNMARELTDLVQWLSRDNSFPNGCFLLTGTGIVPENDFTLQSGDVVEISIDGIGSLINIVA